MRDGAASNRTGRRIARTADSAAVLREDVAGWLTKRRGDDRFGRFAAHLDVLDTVLSRMLAALDGELRHLAQDAGAAGTDVAAVYERCRRIDGSLLVVARTFGWYAEKYDQRLDDRWAGTLRAADEIVRSCWTEPFAALRLSPPTGPLPYLDSRFDAAATPRVSVPPDLRAPADAVVAEYVRELPIPTIALPEVARREPWWLVLAAHETGHHVQRDLAGSLVADTREAVAAAAATVDPELSDAWAGWAVESFADAYSVLMVGPAAAWAIDELATAAPADVVTAPQPADRYPPAAVRLALLGELCHAAGLDPPGAGNGGRPADAGTPRAGQGSRPAGAGLPDAGPPTAAEVLAWLHALPESAVRAVARAAVERHLAAVAAVAGALVDLPVGGSTLRGISGLRADWFADRGRVRGWSRQMRSSHPVLAPLAVRPAARLAIAAGVAAYGEPTTADDVDRLRANLLGVLPSCGGPGVLAAPPPAADVRSVADSLAEDLVRRSRAEAGP